MWALCYHKDVQQDIIRIDLANSTLFTFKLFICTFITQFVQVHSSDILCYQNIFVGGTDNGRS